MWPFKRKTEEIRADTELPLDDPLLKALLGSSGVTKEQALQIPAKSGKTQGLRF